MRLCSISDFRNDAIKKAMFEFRGESKAKTLQLHPTEPNTMVITHGRGSQRIKTPQQAYNAAKSYEKRVKKWATETFGEQYKDGWVQIMNSKDNTHVKIVFEVPKLLMKAQEIKRLEKEKQRLELIEFNEQARRLQYEDKVRSGEFYEEDGLIFKQIRPSNKGRINEEVEATLKTFLNTYGIRVEYVDSLKARGYDAVAISDITNKLIMISKGEQGLDTLPEEVAHFAVELLGNDNPLVKRLMNIIEETEIFQETLNEYKNDELYIYEGETNMEKIKKEAIGKAIGRAIIKGKDINASRGVLSTLKRMWDKVMSKFRKVDNKALNEELNEISEEIAGAITSNTLRGNVGNLSTVNEIFKSKSSKDAVAKETKRALQAIETLETRIKQIKRTEGKGAVSGIKQTISKIRNSIDANQSLLGIKTYLDSVVDAAINMDDNIRKYQETAKSFTNDVGELKKIFDFIQLHSTMVDSIYEMFNEDLYLKERGPKLYEQVEEVSKIINRSRAFVNANMKEATKDTIRRYAEDKSLAESIFEHGEKDISGMSTFLNSAKNSKNEVVRIIDSILRNIKATVHRYVLNKGKDIIRAQMVAEQSGFKDFHKLAERYKDGTLTGNIIREYNYGEYKKEEDKVRAEISRLVGRPYEDIVNLDGDAKRVQIDLWRKFHEANSVKTKDGYKPNSKYKNPVFTELMSNTAVKDYYNLLIETKKESLSKLPSNYQTERDIYKLPQIRKNTLQRIRSKEGSLWSNFTNTIKEDFREAFKVQEDDTEFGNDRGETTINPITGEEIKFLPIHFNHTLSNMSDISLDFSSTYIAYTHMAETYKQRSAKQGEIWLIEDAINNKALVGSRAANKGASNLKKALANLVDTHFYGKTKHMETITYTGIISGKKREINLTKIADRFLKYVRNNNLAFSPFTHLSNYIMGAAYSKVEDMAGRYSTNESKLRAEVELDKNSLGMMSEMGKRLKRNKINLMFELNGVIHDGAKMFKNLDIKNGVGRSLANSGLLSTYEFTDARVKGKMMIAIYDNHRLFDDRFMTFKEFKTLNKNLSKSEINKKWKELSDKTLYDAYEAKDGKLVIKPEFQDYIGNDLLNKITGTLEHVLNNIDGQLSENDKTELHRYILGRAILTHRNWMIAGLEDRFKSRKYNYVTEEQEEGFYKTFGRILLGGFKKVDGKFDKTHLLNTMKSLILAGQDMDENDKANIRKVWSDVAFTMAAIAVAAVLNGIADDEPDDYLAQFGAYLSTRVKMESIALSPVTIHAPFQFIDIIKSPAAGINQFESMVNGLYMFYSMEAFEEVRSGGYKGKTKLEQFLIKRSIVKPFYETMNIEAIKGKNRYVRQMGL